MDKPQFYVNPFGDRYLHEVNRGAFNRLGAATVFQQHFGPKLAAKDALIIVLGTDSGALLRHVQQNGVAEGSRYLFIELAQLLPIIREDVADLELDDSIMLISADEFHGVLREVRFNDYANIGAIELIESIGAIDAYLDDYRPMVAEIKQACSDLGLDVDLRPTERPGHATEIIEAEKNGTLEEAFGTGTAVGIAYIETIGTEDGVIRISEDHTLGLDVNDTLNAIKMGKMEDPFGWMVQIPR